MLILGLETSCDDTGVGIVDADRNIRANVVASQLAAHKPYGGVVPEIAARAHLDVIDEVLAEALRQSGATLADFSAIAATTGPGLIGGVMVGSMMGKAIAAARNLPFISVNHLEAHALTARLTHNVDFPYLLLLASGGHCQLLLVRGVGEYRLMGRTIDDAVGECFDKCAKMLGLGYPGGPLIRTSRETRQPQCFSFAPPHARPPRLRFFLFRAEDVGKDKYRKRKKSFIGERQGGGDAGKHEPSPHLHRRHVRKPPSRHSRQHRRPLPPRLRRVEGRKPTPTTSFVAAGGVAANHYLRARLSGIAEENNVAFASPPPPTL